MSSVVVTAPGQWHVASDRPSSPRAAEVRLELLSAGICGGDLALLAGENAVARFPLTLGHECVARVSTAGPGVGLAPGQAVVVFPTISCGSCTACAAGDHNQCPTMRVMGLSDPNGCFADEFLVAEQQCIAIPDAIADAYGALIEPFAVACHISRRAQLAAGEQVLIIGSGVIGLSTAVAARAHGVAAVHAVDRHATRGAVADRLGVDSFCVLGGDELVDHVRSEIGAVDAVIDTVCSTDTADAALRLLRPGGRYVPVASSKPDQVLGIRYDRLFLKELQVIAARNYALADFHRAVELLDSHRPDLRALVTATYQLDQFAAALSDLAERPAEHLKILLGPSSGHP